MFQYTPLRSKKEGDTVPLQRTVSRREYADVLSWLEELGIEDGYIQEPTRTDDWLPDFTRLNPFPKDQAMPVWHYQSGYVE
jgi:putative pyruvate formate lyase activating enzyme